MYNEKQAQLATNENCAVLSEEESSVHNYERVKMHTPDYILDIRNGRYTKTGAVDKILQECGMFSLPINVWEIARKLNFEVLEANFNKSLKTSGMLIDALEVPSLLEKFKCKRAIILNRNENRAKQAFTIAHELGHFIFHCDEKSNCFDARHFTQVKEERELTSEEKCQKQKEDEVDEFAAMLLMPESMFIEHISKSPNRNNRKKLVAEMAQICMVEDEAVNKRFNELKIAFSE